jgi:hypothetical protein
MKADILYQLIVIQKIFFLNFSIALRVLFEQQNKIN